MEFNTSLDSSSERFIPLRGSSFGSLQVSHKAPRPASLSCRDYWRKFTKNNTGGNYMQYYYKKNQYKDLLVNTLFQSPRRVLYFSPKQKARKENNKDIEEDDWPVKGRNKPLITSPVYVCDLPNLDTPLTWTRQGIDWGSSGFIGFIHKRCCVYTYNPDKNRKFRMVIGEEIGHCLKWNKYGDQFTLSLRRGKLGLWDLPKEKMVRRGHSSDITKGDVSCIVQTDSLIITGHRKGMLQIWNYDLFPVAAEHEAHKGAIVNAKVSCDGNYLATSGTDSFVKIWSLPSCKKIFEIHYDYPITSIDWHPWKAPLLAVGRATRNSFCMLWNVNRPTNEYTLDRFEYAKVDCMTFNPISAELVTGFWLDHPTDESKYSHSIVVQNNLSTIVDDINFHSARAMYLLWDKEGKRLATVGADENLALWDFFGQEKKKQITPIKRDAGIIWNEIIR